MSPSVHQVSPARHREWYAQFGEAAAQDVRLEMPDAELRELAQALAERQIEEDPHVEAVDSGLILPELADRGLSGAFEGLVERMADEAFRSATAAMRSVAP